MFRVYTGSATYILNEVFPLKPPSNQFKKSVGIHGKTYENCTLWIEFFGIFRARNMGTATNHLKRLESVEAFKSKIKSKVMQI